MAQLTRATVLRLEAWARVRLGMPRAEFRAHTLEEWNRLAKEYQKAEVERQREAGSLHFLIAQAGGLKHKSGRPLALDDFFRDPTQRVRRARRADTFKQFMAIFGSRVKKAEPCQRPSAPYTST